MKQSAAATRVLRNDRDGTYAALEAGARRAQDIDAVIAAADAPADPYFRG